MLEEPLDGMMARLKRDKIIRSNVNVDESWINYLLII